MNKFIIVTPSRNQSKFLKNCVKSIKDQINDSFIIHHHVQDAYSTDDTLNFLEKYYHENKDIKNYIFSYEVKKDNGMYDALNHSFEMLLNSNDDCICSWLNCDEQYLKDTLNFVYKNFSKNKKIDILLGNYLVVDNLGKLISYRKITSPRIAYIQALHLSNLSCANFYKSDIFYKVKFDTSLKAVADEKFFIDILKLKPKVKVVKKYLSIFSFTHKNLGMSENSRNEYLRLKRKNPLFLRIFKYLIIFLYRFEKFINCCYFQKFPLVYEIYIDKLSRTCFKVNKGSWLWPKS